MLVGGVLSSAVPLVTSLANPKVTQTLNIYKVFFRLGYVSFSSQVVLYSKLESV